MRRLWQFTLRLTQTQPKLFAALWFAGCGFIAAAVTFIGPAISGGILATFSSLVLPTLSAGIVGYLYGARILDTRRTRTYLQAGLRGILLSVFTFVVFAPLLVLFNQLTQEGTLPQLFVFMAMSVAVIIGAIATTGPLSFCVSTIGAIILFNLFRRAAQSGGQTPRAA
jgi:hypothetical protein